MENNNKGIMSLLIVLVVLLTSLCVLFATGTIEFTKDNNKINSSTNNGSVIDNNVKDDAKNEMTSDQGNINSYIGEYTYSNIAQETGIEIKVMLALASDGTFYIEELETMKQYFYGTYEIAGDKLVLNYMFRWANDQGNYNRINNEKSELSIKENTVYGSLDYRSNDIIHTYTKTSENVTLSKEFINDIIKTYGL
jgi:hypothetical protein